VRRSEPLLLLGVVLGEVENSSLGCQMGVRWVSDGCQMGVRWLPDGCQMVARWVCSMLAFSLERWLTRCASIASRARRLSWCNGGRGNRGSKRMFLID
jgi:hypothetical protein